MKGKINLFVGVLITMILSGIVIYTQFIQTTSLIKLDLTQEESEWLDNHKVIRVTNEPDYAPYDFQIDGEPTGYSVEYVKLIGDRLGIELVFVQDSWGNLLEKAKNKEVDLVHSIFNFTEERREYLAFTKHYKQATIGLLTHSSNEDIHSINDIENKVIVLVAGDAGIAALSEIFENPNLMIVDSYDEALSAVNNKIADVTVTELPIAKYIISKNGYKDIKLAVELGSIAGRDQKYTLAVRKDWAEFTPILEKAMDSLSREELLMLEYKWFPSIISELDKDNKLGGWFVALGLLICLLLAIAAIYLWRKNKGLSVQLDSASGKKFVTGLNIVLFIIVTSIGWVSLDYLEARTKEEKIEFLHTVLNTTDEGVSRWSKEQRKRLRKIASNEKLLSLTTKVLENSEDLESTKEIVDLLSNSEKNIGNFDFNIVDLNGLNIISMIESNIGDVNLVYLNRLEYITKAFDGETLLIPSFVTAINLTKSDNLFENILPIMHFATPLINEEGEVIAVLTEAFDPYSEFNRLMLMGAIGISGETYAFDKDGLMLSESRYFIDLIQTELLEPTDFSIGSLKLNNPGVNLMKLETSGISSEDKKLTFMAQSATKFETGYNKDGYRDYRGVKVIGYWLWDEKNNIGMAAEMNYDEAMDIYYKTRTIILIALSSIMVMSMILTSIVVLLGGRSTKALKLVGDNLENKIGEITAAENQISKLNQDLEARVLRRTQELENEKNFVDRVINSLPGIFYTIGIDGTLLRWNDNYQKIIDINNVDIKNLNFLSTIDKVDREKVLEVFESTLDGEIAEIKALLLTSKGKTIPYLMTGTILKTEDENFIIGVGYDIEEQVRREDELRTLSRVVEQNPISVVITDPKGNISYVNEAFSSSSGYEIDEVLGRNPSIVKSDKTEKSTIRELWDTILSGKTWKGEILNKKKNNELYWEHATISPIMNELGQIISFVSLQEDITERKKLEKELLIAKEIAEDSTKAKSRFLANMSHEIRTPMNAIIGLSGLIVNTDLTQKQSDYISKISTASSNLLGIINDILDFSKIEAGKLLIESIPFDLNEVIDNIASISGLKSSDKGVEMIIIKELDVPDWIVGDSNRLNQILLNLCNNAAKFTLVGQIVLRISVIESKEEKIKLKFSIKDTGIGMTDEEQEKLFKAFSQADSATTRKFGGTGLGLTISKQLLNLMDGSIHVESEKGVGSDFSFNLEFGTHDTIINIEETISNNFKSLKIAILDDNDTALEVYEHYLSNIIGTVELYNNAERFIENVESKEFDVLIMDYQLGNTNGLEVWKTIDIDVKGILTTAFESPKILEEAHTFGLEIILTKPVTRSSLFDVLTQTLGNVSGKVTKNSSNSFEKMMQPYSGNKVLLVEDNVVNQEVAQENLELVGFKVDVANNGQEAVDIIKESGDLYDLILMDLQMPVMDGFEATAQVRKLYSPEELPIIVLSADVISETVKKINAIGVKTYVAKPINLRKLYEAMILELKTKELSEDDKKKFIEQKNIIKTENKYYSFNDLKSTLEIVGALNLIGGNEDLFFKVISKFYDTYGNKFEDQVDAIKDSNEFTMYFHTLKGLAGTIGAKRIEELSKTLEFESNTANVDLKNLKTRDEIEILKSAIAKVCNKIKIFVKEFDDKEASIKKETQSRDESIKKEILSKDDYLLKLENLVDALELYDSSALDVLKGMEQEINKYETESAYNELEKLILEYENDDAINIIKAYL